jgi:hypothetical protein
VKGRAWDRNSDMTWIKSGMINQFVQSMIVSSLWTCEGNHATGIAHCGSSRC